MAAWTALNERRAVRKATLALLHGHTVHQHCKTIAKNPHIAEDIHYSESDRLRDDALDAKIGSCRHDLLRIIYVGRAEPMKGGKLWIETLAQVKARGVGFEASWYGDGAQLTELKKSARALHLSTAELRFHGFVSDRDMVKAAYQKAHILLFCHLTDESPRNLIESLHAATPLVGFDDPFARNLVDEKGAGVLVERGDVPKLVDIVSAIAENRECLVDLVQRAAQSASHLTRDRVFDERSAIVKRELGVMPGRGV